MPRFVLLYHDCPPGYVRPSHWDLMLESGDGLESWALFELPREWHAAHAQTVMSFPNCPPLSTGNRVSAEHLASHRMAYLEFEGPLSGGRGTVVRVASGEFSMTEPSDQLWSLTFDAGTIAGQFTLERAESDSPVWQACARR